jgi:hypothetical protein
VSAHGPSSFPALNLDTPSTREVVDVAIGRMRAAWYGAEYCTGRRYRAATPGTDRSPAATLRNRPCPRFRVARHGACATPEAHGRDKPQSIDPSRTPQRSVRLQFVLAVAIVSVHGHSRWQNGTERRGQSQTGAATSEAAAYKCRSRARLKDHHGSRTRWRIASASERAGRRR